MTSLPSGLVTVTASRVPFAARTTTGSTTEAPVAASRGVVVITARLTGAALEVEATGDAGVLVCVAVVTGPAGPPVQAAVVRVAVSTAVIRIVDLRRAGIGTDLPVVHSRVSQWVCAGEPVSRRRPACR